MVLTGAMPANISLHPSPPAPICVHCRHRPTLAASGCNNGAHTVRGVRHTSDKGRSPPRGGRRLTRRCALESLPPQAYHRVTAGDRRDGGGGGRRGGHCGDVTDNAGRY